MALPSIAGVAASAPAAHATTPRQTFAEVARGPLKEPGASADLRAGKPECSPGSVQGSPPVGRADPTRLVAPLDAARVVDEVAGAQERLDVILKLAESGKTFTPAELLSFQAQVYRASQELDLAGKVVEKATGGLKQILTTQL